MKELKIIEGAERKAHGILGYQETINMLHQQAQLTREETIREVVEFIAYEEGWEKLRDDYLRQLLNQNKNDKRNK